MSQIVLYNAPQSTCSQRVRFVLHYKNLAFTENKLDLFSGDQLLPDYLKINPNGVVPSIVHDGRIVIDSSVIMEYLDEVYPQAGLTPADPVERAHMRSLIRFIDEIPAPAIRVPSYNLAFLQHYQAMTEEEFLALAESKPLRKEFLLAMGRTGFLAAEMTSSMNRLQRSVVRMDESILASGGPWMMGADITLADIAIMPVIVRLDDINLQSMWDGRPAVANWLKLLRAHPCYAKTYYFGSLLTEKYPHLKREIAAQ